MGTEVLLTTAEVSRRFHINESWLCRARRLGGGPKFVALGYRTVRYRESDVVAWIESRTAEVAA